MTTEDTRYDEAEKLFSEHKFLYDVEEVNGWVREPDRMYRTVFLEIPGEKDSVQITFEVDFLTSPPTVNVW